MRIRLPTADTLTLTDFCKVNYEPIFNQEAEEEETEEETEEDIRY